MTKQGECLYNYGLISNFDEGLTFAYNDIEANWEKYREWYLSRMGR